MPAAQKPENELARLNALHRLDILDSAPEEEFDALVKAAALVCNVPISLISLVDESRQWFKASVGLPDVSETPRDWVFCTHAILEEGILEVNDARQDPRFSDNPLVTSNPNIRFYAGATLRLSDGERVGTLCVCDSEPHKLNSMQLEVLGHLAAAAVKALEGRRARISEQKLLVTANYSASIFQNSKVPIITLTLGGTITHWNAAAEQLFAYSTTDMIGQHIQCLVPASRLDEEVEIAKRLHSEPDGVVYETLLLSSKGEAINVSISLAPIKDENGALIGSTKIVYDIREQVLVAKRLEDKQNMYRALSDASPLGVFSCDATGSCTYTNARWQEIFGLSFEQSLGYNWSSTLHPQDREEVFNEWQRTALQRIEFDMEFRVQHRNGSLHFVHARSRLTLDSNDVITGYIGSVEDITTRHRALERLASSEERIRKLYQATPAMLHSIDAQGRLLSVSDYWLSVLGYSRDEVIGHKSVEFMTKESQKIAINMVLPDYFANGRCDNIEYQMLTKSGEVLDVLLSSILERNPDGSPLRSMAVIENVTERNTAKRSSEGLLSAIRSQFIMSITDAKGILIEVNDAFCIVSQYSRQELIGADHSVVNSGYHPNEFFSEMWHTIAKGQPWRNEICNRARDGSYYWVDSVISPLMDGKGQVDRFVAISTEITERKLAQQALYEERQNLASVIEGTGAGTWEWNVQTGQCTYNTQWAAMLGYTLDELAPISVDTCHKLAHLDDVELSNNLLNSHFAGDTAIYECENRMRHRDGHWVWMCDRGRVLTWTADGKPEWMFGTNIDISDRKRQEEALIKNEHLLNSTGEVAGVGGWELDLQTGNLAWTAQTYVIHGTELGYEPNLNEAISFYAPEARPIIKKAVDIAISTGQGWDHELPFIQVNGQQIWVRAVGNAVFESGKCVRLIGAIQDITELVNQRLAIEAANQRMSIATDSGGIGIWEFNLINGSINWDDWMYRIFGLSESNEPVSYEVFTSHLHPDDRAAVKLAVQKAIDGVTPYDTEFRIIWADGSVHSVRATGNVVRDKNGRALNMIGANWEVTKLRQLATELAEQHEMLRVTLQSIGDAVVTTDAKGFVTWLNPVAERMTGWLNQEAIKKPLEQVFNIINEETRQPASNPVTTCLKDGEVVGLGSHTILISRNGTEYGIEDSAAPIRDTNSNLLGVVLVFHDVTEQRRLSGEMNFRATHDPLTGLINRAEFESRLTRVFEHARDNASEHALMFIDLDQFKLVNDACGHSAGDLLLQQVSKLFQDAVRSRDTLARLGGDEFGIILEQCSTEQAQRVAQSICDCMDEFRFIHDGKRFRIGTSIGLVPVDNRWANTEVLMQAADTSCYVAKEAGRNRVHSWFDTDLAMRARHGEMQWATRLEQALDENKFVLFAQRIESINDHEHGLHAEVLIRMIDDDGAYILPSLFIPAAERFHFASRIDRWVLSHAIDWLKSLEDLSSVNTLCINLSGQSVGDRAFHRQAIELLTDAGEKICKRVCLEITETVAITNMADAMTFIEQTHALGVRIALDDFGAGSSSFGYLKTLKVDVLKIDGQFIQQLINNPLNEAAVRCFVDVAHVIGLKTVAEFVDCPEVLARIKEIGVDFAQGFLLHKPEPLVTILDVASIVESRLIA